MDQRTLAVLEELLRFRDGVARALDLPPFKVLGTDTVRQMAEKMPRRPADLEGITGLSPKLCKRYGHDILDATARGAALPADMLPSYPSPQRFVKDREKGELLKRLKLWRESRAGELGIEAGILVNNSVLEVVADAVFQGKGCEEYSISLKHWQNEAFGNELRRFVNALDSTA
jgi:ribonuclease D